MQLVKLFIWPTELEEIISLVKKCHQHLCIETHRFCCYQSKGWPTPDLDLDRCGKVDSVVCVNGCV